MLELRWQTEDENEGKREKNRWSEQRAALGGCIVRCPEYEDRVRAGRFIVPRAAYLKDKRLLFFYGLFNSSVNPPPRARCSPPPPFVSSPPGGKLASRGILNRGTLLPSQNVIPRSRYVRSVRSNNVARKSSRCLFHRDGELGLTFFPVPTRDCTVTIRSQTRERTWLRKLGRGN